jgi:hypothetical protein
MRDGGRIIGGLAILCAVAVVPLWLGWSRGAKAVSLPRPVSWDRCLESRADMRKNHPALLASWRERVVRQGDRVHDKGDGRAVRISLTETCLGCHGKAADFCDKCHAQSAVTLSCWQCHAPQASR